MAKHLYSTYEAKARLSEILRAVREGRTITIAHRGEPVAEVRPIPRETETLEARVQRLERAGALVRAAEPGRAERLRAVARKPGALKRFLEERRGG